MRLCHVCCIFNWFWVCIYGSSTSSVTATGSGICMSSGSGAGSSVCTGSSSCMGSGSGTGSTVCIGSGSTTGSGACMGSGAVWLLPYRPLPARDLFSGLILITNDLIYSSSSSRLQRERERELERELHRESS